MAPPAWAYDVDNFIPSPDSEFICSICQNVFCEPLMTPCDHVFCKHCITSWLTNNSNCPICRKFTLEFELKKVIPMLKNLISNLTLHCHNFKSGCNEILTIDGCEAHEQSCSHELIKCSNSPCTKKLDKKMLHFHETVTCPHIHFIPCDACELMIPSRISGEHNCIMALKEIIEANNTISTKKDDTIDGLQKQLQKESRENLDREDTNKKTIADLELKLSKTEREKSEILLEKRNIERELELLKRRIGHSSNNDVTQCTGLSKENEKQLQVLKSCKETSMISPDSSYNFSLIPPAVYKPYSIWGDINRDEDRILYELIQKDINEWDYGNQWLLTCYGPFSYRASVPGFNDVSFEELRFETSQAKKNYSFTTFTGRITVAKIAVRLEWCKLRSLRKEYISIMKNLLKEESLSASVINEKNEIILKNIIHDVDMELPEKSIV